MSRILGDENEQAYINMSVTKATKGIVLNGLNEEPDFYTSDDIYDKSQEKKPRKFIIRGDREPDNNNEKKPFTT